MNGSIHYNCNCMCVSAVGRKLKGTQITKEESYSKQVTISDRVYLKANN